MNGISGASDEWRRYGLVVLAATIGFSILSVLPASLSLFIEPLSGEFGWKRTLIALGYTCATVVIAPLSPFFGALIDRYGPRRLALPGIIITSATICAFASLTSSPVHWIMLWVLYGVVAVSVKTTIWTATVAGLFKKGQGLALGVTLCGAALGNAIVPPLTNELIASYGWRWSFVLLGTGWGSLTFLLCLLFLHDAHSNRRRQSTGDVTTKKPVFDGISISEAWRNVALWRIGIATFVTMALSIGFSIHQIAILEGAGVSRSHAARLAGLAGIAAIAGKLVTGLLLDRFKPNWTGGLTLTAMALVFGLLIDGVQMPWLVVIAMLVNGYTQGTNLQICGYLTAIYAGMRNYGAIFGFMTSLIAIGSGFGPVIAGFIFDTWGNYQWFLIAGTIGSVLSGVMLVTLPPYPRAHSDYSGDPEV